MISILISILVLVVIVYVVMSGRGRAEYWIGRENGTIPETQSMKEYLGGPDFWWPQLKIVLNQMRKESNKSNRAIAETILDLMKFVEEKYPNKALT